MIAICHRRTDTLHRREVQKVLRRTTAKLGLKDVRGRPYTDETDVTHLHHNFIRRLEHDYGMSITFRTGHGMGVQRVFACSRENVISYRDEVIICCHS